LCRQEKWQKRKRSPDEIADSYFFFPQEKVTKRTLSQTKFPNKFYTRELKVPAAQPGADQGTFLTLTRLNFGEIL